MEKKSLDIYVGLCSYFLPEGVLNYFEVVDFAETIDAGDHLYNKVLHLYLDELDNRSKAEHGSAPNGFTEERLILDFPIRSRKTILHVRRRRWLDSHGKSFIVDLDDVQINHPKTRYSKELAIFLKATAGQ